MDADLPWYQVMSNEQDTEGNYVPTGYSERTNKGELRVVVGSCWLLKTRKYEVGDCPVPPSRRLPAAMASPPALQVL